MQQLIVSKETTQQNEALGELIRKLEAGRRNMLEIAHAYKKCVELGMDVSRYVSRGMAFRLTSLADGKLLSAASERLLGNDAMTSVMASMPTDTQEMLLERGVEIWRDGETRTVPIDDVRPNEARRLLDSTGGRPRLLSAQEQANRLVPAAPRHDKLVELRLTPEEMDAINIAAHKAGQSVAHYIKRQLYLAGIIDTRAKKK